MPKLAFSVGRLIEENAIQVEGTRGWMVRVIPRLRIPAGMLIEVTDHTGGKETTRRAVAADDLDVGRGSNGNGIPRALFLCQAGDRWELRSIAPPGHLTRLQEELSASFEILNFQVE